MKNFSVQDFLEKYIKKIVKHPNEVSITSSVGKQSSYVIYIKVSDEDIGKIIGKGGKMVSSLKSVISACKAKDNISYELVVVSSDDVK